ncbi:ZP3 protein, partial [Polypterus senegalus]
MQATPFPYELLRPRPGDHYAAMPLALQRAMNPRLPPIVRPSPVVPQPRRAVAVSCFDGKMFVRVNKFLCGFGCKDSDLILGKGCTSTSQFGSEVLFEYSLQQCDTKAQVVNGMLVYSNTLYYKPSEPKGPIRRSSPFSVSLLCSYERWYELDGHHALCSCCDSQCAKDTGSKLPKEVKRMMSNGPLQILASEDEQTVPHHLSDLHEDFPVQQYLNVGKNFKPEDEQILPNDLGNDLENQEASFEMVHETLSDEEIQPIINSDRNPLLDKNGAESNTFHSFQIQKMSESESGFKFEEKVATVERLVPRLDGV